jgi:hypothetical protein
VVRSGGGDLIRCRDQVGREGLGQLSHGGRDVLVLVVEVDEAGAVDPVQFLRAPGVLETLPRSSTR